MSFADGIVVVIPALDPGEGLLELVDRLRDLGLDRIVVVDDGSSPCAERIFRGLVEARRAIVLGHVANRGKGRALKTALAHVLTAERDVRGVVTVDADGQHAPADVVRVAASLRQHPGDLILGVRSFGRRAPLRNRLGNALSRWLVRVLMGRSVSDTQTGLRGIPAALLPALVDLPGERYEYETAMLLAAGVLAVPVREVKIATIYEGGASHFKPVPDSLRIGSVLARFARASLIASRHLDLAISLEEPAERRNAVERLAASSSS